MVVIALEKCPLSLRGDLSKWLLEISLGVYVGKISARVREKLWQRICEELKSGRATMVYSAHNEQRMSFRVHNTSWKPVDYDGVVLMMHPNNSKLLADAYSRQINVSNASRHRYAVKARNKKSSEEPDEYVVVGIETTGFNPETEDIIEIAAIRVELGEVTEEFQTLIKAERPISDDAIRLTNLCLEEHDKGETLESAIDKFLDFITDYPLVIHNVNFSLSFIDYALEQIGIDEIENDMIDTLLLARKKLPKLSSYKLEDLASYYGIEHSIMHRALTNCLVTKEVFTRLV